MFFKFFQVVSSFSSFFKFFKLFQVFSSFFKFFKCSNILGFFLFKKFEYGKNMLDVCCITTSSDEYFVVIKT